MKSFLIGPVGLTIAILTVLAFVAAMALQSMVSTVAADGAPQHARRSPTMSVLLVLARLRWPLAVLTLLITGYRIYSLS